jgi:hypothetical protein
MRKTLEAISLGALAGTVAGFIVKMRRAAHAKWGISLPARARHQTVSDFKRSKGLPGTAELLRP